MNHIAKFYAAMGVICFCPDVVSEKVRNDDIYTLELWNSYTNFMEAVLKYIHDIQFIEAKEYMTFEDEGRDICLESDDLFLRFYKIRQCIESDGINTGSVPEDVMRLWKEAEAELDEIGDVFSYCGECYNLTSD